MYPQRRTNGREATVIDGEYHTNDMRLCVSLAALGHTIARIYKDQGVQFYAFYEDEIAADRDAYLRGTPLEVNIHAVWREHERFRYNLQLRA